MSGQMTILKNAQVYSPMYIGQKDILLCGGKIIAIEGRITMDSNIYHTTIDCTGKKAIPGIIDNHVHLIGGGGEAGFQSRVPEINLSDLTLNGITSVIGVLGTDGFTRNIKNLLAKVKALNNEGLSAYALTGSYQLPVKTLTDSIENDIVFIEEIIGVGEIALSDHRDSAPTEEELRKVISASRVAGLISDKAGVVNVHLGDGNEGLTKLMHIVEDSSMLKSKILPTHVTRNRMLFDQSLAYAKEGGYIDMTADDQTHEFVREAVAYGVDLTHISVSSDAMGSLPVFNEQGEMIDIKIAKPNTMIQVLKNLVLKEVTSMEEGLQLITSNVASLYKLKSKGRIEVGYDADIVLLDERFSITDTICHGKFHVMDCEVVVRGMFEKERQNG